MSGEMMPYDPRDEKIADLEHEVANLRAALGRANIEVDRINNLTALALGNIRRQLAPLYRALQGVFGELDALGVEEMPTTGNPPPADNRTTAIWASWKSRMPGGPAKIIDALLLQPGMNSGQLAIAIGVHRNSIPDMIYKLNKAGLIQKDGNKFSLKTL